MTELLQVLRIFCAAALTIGVCCLLGRLALFRLRPLLSPVEELALSFVIGSALLSTLVLALGVAGWVSVWAYLLLALIVAGLWARFARQRHPEVRFRLMKLPKPWMAGILLVALPYGVLYGINALAPEFSADGSEYHLGLVARYVSEGHIMGTPTNLYSGLSQGVEMLFLYAYVLGRHSAATLVHLAFLFALALMMLSFGSRHGMPAVGVAAAGLVFASPIVGFTATSAYVDVAAACVAFGCLYLLTLWEKHSRISLALYAGILAGFCYGSKYSAVGAAPLSLLILAWGRRRSLFTSRTALTLAALLAGVALTAGPWILRNSVWYGNPLAPFYNDLFPNEMVTVEFERSYRAHLRNWGELPSKWDIPMEITVRGEPLQGFFGPMLLASPLALLALGNPMGRRMLLAALLFGATYYANLGTRFLIPALPFVSVALAIGVRRWRPALAGLVVAHAVLSWPSVAATYCDQYAPRLDQFPVRAAFRLDSEETFLASRFAEWPLVEFLNSRTAPGERVFALGALPQAYIGREVVVDYYSATGEALRDTLWSAYIEDRMPTDTVELSFPARSVRALRLRYDGPAWEPGWGVSEVRVVGPDGQALDSSSWRFRAEPNPGHARFGVDGNPVTRWQTWQPLDSGMHLDVVLESDQPVSAVVLRLAPQHSWLEPTLWSSADEETWTELPRELHKTSAPLNLAELRADAIRALRDAGMSYLAVHTGNYLAEELRENSSAWGITEIHSSPIWILYRL